MFVLLVHSAYSSAVPYMLCVSYRLFCHHKAITGQVGLTKSELLGTVRAGLLLTFYKMKTTPTACKHKLKLYDDRYLLDSE